VERARSSEHVVGDLKAEERDVDHMGDALQDKGGEASDA
jgi:hypothetical protein